MKRLRTGLFLAVLSLFASASAALACMNDRESARAEQEFKSSYNEKQKKTPAESQPGNQMLYYYLSGAGAALFLGAITLTVRTTRRRDTDV